MCRVRTFFFIFFPRIRYIILMCMYVHICTCSHTHTHAYTRVNLMSYKLGSCVNLKKKCRIFVGLSPIQGLGLVSHTLTHILTHTLTLSVCRVRTFFYFFSWIRYSIFMCMYVQICTCSHTHTHAYTRVNLISYKLGSCIHLKKKSPIFVWLSPIEGLG